MRLVDLDGKLPGDIFKSPRYAAADFAKCYNDNSIKDNKEYGTRIYAIKDNTNKVVGYSYASPNQGNGDTMWLTDDKRPYKNTANIAIAHTHAAYDSELKGGNDQFSQRDIDIYTERKQLGYVATPSGELWEYNPSTEKDINLTASSDPAFKNIPSDQQDPAHTNKVDARNPNLPKNEPSKSTFTTMMTVIFDAIFKK